MNELIRVFELDGINGCDARELHGFLELGRKFADWIKDRIVRYGFVEGVDFTVFSRFPENGSGNRGASIEYHLSLDMAKELAMVENNPKGRRIRRYFIECERLLQQQQQLDVGRVEAIAARAATEAVQSFLASPKPTNVAEGPTFLVADRIRERCPQHTDTDYSRIIGRLHTLARRHGTPVLQSDKNRPLTMYERDLRLLDDAIDYVWHRHRIAGLPLFQLNF